MSNEGKPDPPGLECTSCGCEIDWCAFCDEADCSTAECYACVSIVLKQRIPALHAHGG